MGATGDPDRHPVVALVASAGGLDALRRVLGELPAGLDATVVVLLHQEPRRESQLVEILARDCALPVAVAGDGAALAPRQVVVVPPGRHALATADGRVALIVSGASPPSRPSADLLLTTLAVTLGPRAIAVVLSGTGHDGATGATAVHRFGGRVLASDEASSEFFAMPAATIDRDDAVDDVLALVDVGPAIVRLVAAAGGA